MAPNHQRPRTQNDEKVANAFRAMKGLDIAPEVVKPVLKRLLKLYDGKWELIEEDNYRTLADAIFEPVDDKEPLITKQKSKAPMVHDDQQRPSKRSHSMSSKDQATSKSENGNITRPLINSNHSNSIVPSVSHQNQNTTIKKLFHKIKDISRGTETINIPLIDEIGIDLPKFVYIHQNTPYQDAYVQFSLARVADDGCCLKCKGDCLSSRVPCACSRETGGEFAYTSNGLLKDEFLDACISMNREPQDYHMFKCQDCPLEKAKNVQNPEACKGHPLKKFIKECWRKCGCTMECGNRVVQRGPTRKLQVFSVEGKGWGIRTLENLPKGSFICEYVGEILTNTELYERNMSQSQKNERHTYPIYLDADWGSEQGLKDEEALCLDATYYGNLARFINHKCFDSNLLEIPVEVETPDHHYYHIAFFTKRNVEAYEELTWDYGIDFEDVGHPIKAFECRCGSQYCRDVRRKGSKEKEVRVKRSETGSSRRLNY